MFFDLSAFQWVSLVIIILLALAGGYVPLFRHDRARKAGDYPDGEAFAAGAFLALAFCIMLPSGFQIFSMAWPGAHYPVASLVATVVFVGMLALAHWSRRLATATDAGKDGLNPPSIAIIMTAMIALPSFFMGVTLADAGVAAELLILLAIILHKSSAGFALALKIVRSTLSRGRALLLFAGFAVSTPLGIIVGADLRQLLGGPEMLLVKAFILSAAAGVFFFMATLDELEEAPLVEQCARPRGFLLMLAGFLLTAFVRFLVGEAHHV